MSERVVIGDAERVWIYALCDPVTDAPRYVGKTSKSLMQRLKEHKQLARRERRLPVQRWMNAVAGVNLCGVYMRVLETASGETWASRERRWIDYGRRNGWELFNLTDGGDGLHGLVPSDEHRARNSEAHKKGAMFSCRCGKEFWRKPSAIKAGNCKFCSRECYARSIKGISRPVSIVCMERGLAAAAAARRAAAHCKRGHDLSGDNLFITSNGSRGCKECRKIHKRAYRERAKCLIG